MGDGMRYFSQTTSELQKVAEIQIRDKCEYKSREQNLEDYKGDSSLAWKIWIGLDLEGSGSLLEIKKKKKSLLRRDLPALSLGLEPL